MHIKAGKYRLVEGGINLQRICRDVSRWKKYLLTVGWYWTAGKTVRNRGLGWGAGGGIKS
jgi:hypothetical protein